ncbi:3-phenylpropionate/trans-cinnamate dioxygenase ferredoxin reductase subunit [Jatrophihabitans sp. GAS493]|uniref:NAD(P)/FAD-dependent oxidoreductase n=1 Tax=Jatrophihabitans sp. GAS493 TaxID=1907575 RepID=UPI000BB84992|nr:FAD-dependent oxidoreductase [Jatrophihabitans sp. GAS493]SOD74815.1 3-phenylpropionate/trans-cinnamate dioxygenase ferredoxin reductase subunit [Jatrophihabitans sp. GAS493]
MPSNETFVIVGASLAGAKAAEALREQGFDGRVILLGDEVHRPYERPPLSKGYLTGKAERDSVFVHPANWYSEQNVELQVATTVTGIDRSRHQIVLADDESIRYDRLLLTTGARPRPLSLPGSDAAGVHYLRTLDDSESLGRVLATAKRLVVIGAGWIGLEAAAAARAAGVEVSVVESAELPLLRVLGPQVASVFADLHRAHGVDLRLGVQLQEITTADGRATGVRLGDGSLISADAVLIGVGVVPNVSLAEQAGLEVDNGVLVDDALRSSDPDIFAAGDVANAFHPLLQRRIRVEHWANALKQPKVAAAAMRGEAASYRDLPYFYTDQYDLGMEYVGYVEPGKYDEVIFRGDAAAREFVAFWLLDGRVLAGMNVNVWDVVEPIKAIISAGERQEPQRLADVSIPLDSL